jgi:hypothetical protein
MSWQNRHRMHKHSADYTFVRNELHLLEDACILVDSSGGAVEITLPKMYQDGEISANARPEMGSPADGFRCRVRRAGASAVSVTADASNKMDLGALGASDSLAADGDSALYVWMKSENSWVKF